MDKKAIDESIKFRKILRKYLNERNRLRDSDLQQEVKTLKKKGVKDGRPKGIRGSKIRKGSI